MTYLAPAVLALLSVAGFVKANSALAWVPFDLTLAAVAAVALGAYAAWLRGGRRASAGVPVVLLLWTTFLLGVMGASFEGYSASKVSTLFTVTLLCAVAPFVLLTRTRQREVFLGALLLIALASSIQGVFFEAAALPYSDRLAFNNADTITTAQLAGAGALVALIWGLRPALSLARRAALFGVSALLLYTLLASGSRGPFAALVVAMVATFALVPAYRKYRVRAVIFGGLMLAVAIQQAVSSGNVGVDRILTAVATGQVDENRTVLWATARSALESNPFGIGWGGFEPLSFSPYPHNLFLEVGAEAGWIALVALFAALVIAGVSLRRGATTVDVVAIFALFVFATAEAMVSSDINGVRLMWVTAGVGWALMPTSRRRQPIETQRPKAKVT